MPSKTKATKSPWKDRIDLLKDIAHFISRNSAFFAENAKRMSDLFEMSVYNDAVRYYKRKKFEAKIEGLRKDGAFRYKLSTSGLAENFSYFKLVKETKRRIRGGSRTFIHTDTIEVHHNIKLQSAHDSHIYFTADVSVIEGGGVVTERMVDGRRHSYARNSSVVTFFEAKNMNPFPELMFSFSGLVLEILPTFILGHVSTGSDHLLPCLVMSGKNGRYAERVATSLSNRYALNIISGLYAYKGQIYSFKNLREYDR